MLDEFHPKPVTLYVESINTKPQISYPDPARLFSIDAEMDMTVARGLLIYLEERVRENAGAIRIRLTGRIVVS